MAKSGIDRDRLRAHVRRLHKRELLQLLDRAIDLVPDTRLAALVEGSVAPGKLRPDGGSARRLLKSVEVFREASLRGDYYEAFDVNSKNFMEKSGGTETWFAECERLFVRCAAAAKKRPDRDAREAFEILFGLLRNIDRGDDDIVFFADEGGSWEAGVDWRDVLPRYFDCLAATAQPDEYARAATSVIEAFVAYDRDRYLRAARSCANPAQKKALRALRGVSGT